MGDVITVHEVGLRDGLQNQPRVVPTEGKLQLLDALLDAGLRSIEAASFVSPKAVPQMADAAAIFARLPQDRGAGYEALVPNEKGYERAVEAGVTTVAWCSPVPTPSTGATSTCRWMRRSASTRR